MNIEPIRCYCAAERYLSAVGENQVRQGGGQVKVSSIVQNRSISPDAERFDQRNEFLAGHVEAYIPSMTGNPTLSQLLGTQSNSHALKSASENTASQKDRAAGESTMS